MYLIAEVAEGEVDAVVLAGVVRKRAHLGFAANEGAKDFANVVKVPLR